MAGKVFLSGELEGIRNRTHAIIADPTSLLAGETPSCEMRMFRAVR
jgi:hypothetical protein